MYDMLQANFADSVQAFATLAAQKLVCHYTPRNQVRRLKWACRAMPQHHHCFRTLAMPSTYMPSIRSSNMQSIWKNSRALHGNASGMFKARSCCIILGQLHMKSSVFCPDNGLIELQDIQNLQNTSPWTHFVTWCPTILADLNCRDLV